MRRPSVVVDNGARAIARLAPWLLMAAGSASLAGPTATRPDQPVALTVIHDSGRSIPIAPYLSYLVASTEQPGVLPGFVFPIRAGLRPGLLAIDGVQVFEPQWLVQPIFVVGTDKASMLWLKHNRDRLLALHAWGVVIAAPEIGSFKALQGFAEGLPVAPSRGAWLDQRLARAGVTAYPVLIGIDGKAHQILRAGALGAEAQP